MAKTKQIRVVSMLALSTAGTNPPLSEDRRAKLSANYCALVVLIDTRDSRLLRELQTAHWSTYKQRVCIESAVNELVGSRQLFDYIGQRQSVRLR
jgi:hypothetical protein